MSQYQRREAIPAHDAGKGNDANLPGHEFVLVGGSGRIRWVKEFRSMYVSSSDLLTKP